MTYEEFIQLVAESAGMPVQDVNKVMESFDKCLIQGLQTTGSVSLNIGMFQVDERPERRGINPRTGDEIVMPGRRVVRFRATDSLNEKL